VPPSLFSAYPPEQLPALGVAEPLLPLIAKLTTEEELLALAKVAPQLTSEVLPALHGHPTWTDELSAMARQVKEWLPADGAPPSIGVAVPTRRQQAEVEEYLTGHDVPATSLGADGPRKPDAVHVGTLHRFKGLKYQRMLVAGVSAGLTPDARIADHRATDPDRYERELKQAARSCSSRPPGRATP
jgi:hypothetical protein